MNREFLLKAIFGLILCCLGLIILLAHTVISVQDPPKQVKQDTIKVDTLTVKTQQLIYKKKMIQQQIKLDSLIKAKKEKK